MDIQRFQRLLEHIPLSEFFAASPEQLQHYGLTVRQSELLLAPDHPRIDACQRWLAAAPDRHFIRCIDPEYPPLLRQIKQPPLALFVVGQPALLQQPQLAIVGSRQPTPGARQTAFEFAAALSQAGLTISSGLAQGIDGAAHQGALSVQGGTVAVLGHGLQHIYPKQHTALTGQIATQGALVSEYMPDQPPRPEFFRCATGLWWD